MVFKIIWSPRALEDLAAIVKYIRRNNPTAALNFGQKLIKKAESLASFPERGRIIQKFRDPNIREVFFSSYRIAYRIKPQQTEVEIARIWHGARNEEGIDI